MADVLQAPPAGSADRGQRRSGAAFDARRDELAAAALQTLAERGYARTSLREIAQNTHFSHGVLHYYFRDKMDLITHCVKGYKVACVARYDEVVAGSGTADDLAAGFAAVMARTADEDGALHRLWYDLRSQAMFEPDLRADVLAIDASLEAMIWRVVSRYAALCGRPAAVEPSGAYTAFDGAFQQALLHHLAGRPGALETLATRVRSLLPLLVQPA